MKRRVFLLVHNVRSLWNVGSFFRTADAFGVEKIILTGYTGTPPRKEITKTAIGAEEWVPWEYEDDPLRAITALRNQGCTIVALENNVTGTRNIREFTPSEQVCLIVGHEIDGIDQRILDVCDAAVHIPMQGKKESLNVAVAAGIGLEYLAS